MNLRCKMKNTGMILTILAGIFLVGCVEITDRPYQQKLLVDRNTPHCRQETTVVVYDTQGAFEYPGCVDYYYPGEVQGELAEPQVEPQEEEPQLPSVRKIKRTVKRTTKTIPQKEDEINIDEKEFPAVERNKYVNEVILQNQNTGVLAYCRGTEKEIEICVSRLENSCYVRLEDIPRFAAKYDYLKTGTYPTRRWREGEHFPRW